MNTKERYEDALKHLQEYHTNDFYGKVIELVLLGLSWKESVDYYREGTYTEMKGIIR